MSCFAVYALHSSENEQFDLTTELLFLVCGVTYFCIINILVIAPLYLEKEMLFDLQLDHFKVCNVTIQYSLILLYSQILRVYLLHLL